MRPPTCLDPRELQSRAAHMLLIEGDVEEEEVEREEVKMETKRKKKREKEKREPVMEGEEAGAEEGDNSEDTALGMSGGEDPEDPEMKRELLLHRERKREETWRVRKEEGEEVVVAVEDVENSGDAVASVEDSGDVVDSVEDSEEQEVDSEEIGVDSEEIGEDSVAAAGPGEGVREEEGEDSVEVTTEVKAVLNSTNSSPSHKFSNYQKVSSLLQPHRLKFVFFIFDNSSLDILLYSQIINAINSLVC